MLLLDSPRPTESPDASATGRLAPGETFGGRFDVHDFLGAGGEFDVYLAFDRVRREEVALKVLVLPGDPRFGKTVASTVADEFAARREGLWALYALHRETLDAISRAHEVRVPPVFEVETEGDPSEWFVVESVVEGAFAFGEWCRIERDVRAVVSALASVGRLLAALHERGVVHRDVHGANILVDREARLWLTDFSHAIRPLHRGAFALLSPWNAPEEREDVPLTASADVYGFARLVLEALGHHARRARERHPELSRALVSRLRAIEHRYLECAPEERGSLVSLLDELASIARLLSPRPRQPERRSSRWTVALALASATAIAGVSATIATAVRSRAPSASALAAAPVTEIRLPEAPVPLVWRGADSARSDPERAEETRAPQINTPVDSQTHQRDFARGAALFRRDAPASERLARYAAEEFLREARSRATRGWGAACMRSKRGVSRADRDAVFRVSISPSTEDRRAWVDRVALLRGPSLDARTSECLRARIASIAAADPGRPIDVDLPLRLSWSSDEPQSF